MTDETENRGYNVPEAGETDWHEPVNDNWEAIDADMQNALDGAGDAATYRLAGTVALEAGDQYDHPVYVLDGESVDLTRIGISLTNMSEDSDVLIRHQDPDGSNVATFSAGTAPNIIDDPSQDGWTNDTDEDARAYFNIVNDSDTDYTPDSDAANGIEYEITYRIE